MQKESLEFGHGSFVGSIMSDQTFFELSAREQAQILGWADSCPVVTELTDPSNPNPGRGPEAMVGRYAQVNFWFGYISRAVQAKNPELYDQLMTSVPRHPMESVGKHELESVPDSYFDEMPPLSTLAGYGISRLFIEQIGIGKWLGSEETQARFLRGHAALDQAIDTAATPNELLALAAENIAKQGDVEPAKVLSLVMSQGWLDEHTGYIELSRLRRTMKELAPELSKIYRHLSADEKAALKLA